MSIGGRRSRETQESRSRSRSKSRTDPQLFGPEQILLPEKREASRVATPGILEEAFTGGLSPQERARQSIRASEDIGRATTGAIGSLRDITAKSRVRGGVEVGDISDILEAGVETAGKTTASIEEQNRLRKQQSLQNLLDFLSAPTPFGIGAKSRAESRAEAESKGTGKTDSFDIGIPFG